MMKRSEALMKRSVTRIATIPTSSPLCMLASTLPDDVPSVYNRHVLARENYSLVDHDSIGEPRR